MGLRMSVVKKRSVESYSKMKCFQIEAFEIEPFQTPKIILWKYWTESYNFKMNVQQIEKTLKMNN